jgi:N-methylhydantoinase A
VTLRMRGKIASPEKLTGMKVEEGPARLQESQARVWFGGKQMRTAILPRAALATQKKYRGPAIITEYSATTVVPPGLPFQADKPGNLLVEVV